ncbi:MAG: hypothetical protein WDZ94_05630 [Patescibacteria group bacterium]
MSGTFVENPFDGVDATRGVQAEARPTGDEKKVEQTPEVRVAVALLAEWPDDSAEQGQPGEQVVYTAPPTSPRSPHTASFVPRPEK